MLRSTLHLAIYFTGLLLTCVAHAADKPAEQSHRLRILTYNIHHGEGVDRKFDLPRIAKVILSAKPDLVALQEVDVKTNRSKGVDQAAELGKLTKMHVAFGKAMDWNGGQYGEAILSRWKIESSKNIDLPFTEGREPRCALSVIVTLPNGGPKLTLVGTHLDHFRDPTDRIAQAKKLNEVFATDQHPLCILAGDLNATPDSEPMKLLFKHWRAADATKKTPTVPVDQPKRKIDYVLFRPANRWKVVETKVIAERVASDHLPVLAVLEYVPESPVP